MPQLKYACAATPPGRHGQQSPGTRARPTGTTGGWRLVGSAGLQIDRYSRSADAGYWIDAAFEGRGLVTRTMTVLLDQAFGPLGLARVTVRTEAANQRSRAVAVRLGFTEEGLHRQAMAFGDREHGGPARKTSRPGRAGIPIDH